MSRIERSITWDSNKVLRKTTNQSQIRIAHYRGFWGTNAWLHSMRLFVMEEIIPSKLSVNEVYRKAEIELQFAECVEHTAAPPTQSSAIGMFNPYYSPSLHRRISCTSCCVSFAIRGFVVLLKLFHCFHERYKLIESINVLCFPVYLTCVFIVLADCVTVWRYSYVSCFSSSSIFSQWFGYLKAFPRSRS
jgi:hypothetical protein